jgi:hypothetical protein
LKKKTKDNCSPSLYLRKKKKDFKPFDFAGTAKSGRESGREAAAYQGQKKRSQIEAREPDYYRKLVGARSRRHRSRCLQGNIYSPKLSLFQYLQDSQTFAPLQTQTSQICCSAWRNFGNEIFFGFKHLLNDVAEMS